MAAGFLLCSIDQMLRPATLPFHGERVTVRAGSLFIEAWLSMTAGARTAEIAGDPFGPPTYVELPAADAEAQPAATAVAMINFKGNMTFFSMILSAAREAQTADGEDVGGCGQTEISIGFGADSAALWRCYPRQLSIGNRYWLQQRASERLLSSRINRCSGARPIRRET